MENFNQSQKNQNKNQKNNEAKNGKKQIKGAKVEILWKRSSIEVSQLDQGAKVKENPRNVS